MGLQNNNQSVKYLKIKEGKFLFGEESYSELEGTISKIYYKDEEYEGQPVRKLVLIVSDQDDNYNVAINVENSMYGSVVSFLANANLTQPLTLQPSEQTRNLNGKDTTYRNLFVRQHDIPLKSYFKENNIELPRWEAVVINKKTMYDKSKYLDFLEDFVTKKLIPYVSPLEPVENSTVPSVSSDEDIENELPF